MGDVRQACGAATTSLRASRTAALPDCPKGQPNVRPEDGRSFWTLRSHDLTLVSRTPGRERRGHGSETMRAHEHDQEHDQEYGSRHEHDEAVGPHAATEDVRASAELPHVLRAAATGRSDVVGRSGMGTLQRTVGNGAVTSMLQREGDDDGVGDGKQAAGRSPVHDVVSSGGGQSLDPDTRTDMESRLGADFSDVRVHTDSAAHDSAKDVGARAYTVGNNVVFQRDAYDPSSHEGRTTIAHELTHVVQQRSGPVDGTEAPGGIRVSDPSDRFEQEASANAERVMAQPAPVPEAGSAPASVPVAAPSASAAVQRQAEDEEEEPADVQGSFVQRATGDAKAKEEEEETPPE